MRNGVMGHVGSTKAAGKSTAGTPVGARKNSSKDDVTARARYAQMKSGSESYKELMQQRIRDFQTQMVSEGTKYQGSLGNMQVEQSTEYSQKAKEAAQQMAAQKARKEERKRAAKAVIAPPKQDKSKPLNWLGQAAGMGAAFAKKQSFTGTMWEKKQWQLDAEERDKRGN